ncbi:ATP-binding cassette subfamily B protein [Metamycoplasma subdolum]|uniref:ATP-binding cassette subfamily B protein n=1 Tax=Metamycoplasma subdolum TaxID=92407 RepID=A0A3M0A3B5_9BACT|nr:ABC transporter ATP-binding protein [Metamycoplasma subdolum]RMA79137.1 ATP-binding cassette subfamily B protein [Metamycoplasma subdolum]
MSKKIKNQDIDIEQLFSSSSQDLNNTIVDPKKKVKDMSVEERRKHFAILKKAKKYSFKKLLSYLNQRKGLFFWVIFLNFISAICLTGSTYGIGLVLDEFINTDFLMHNFDGFKFWGAISLVAGFYLIQEIITLVSATLSTKSGAITTLIMRDEAYKALMKMPISYFESQDAGKLMSIFSNDIENISYGLTACLSPVFQTLFISITTLGFMLYSSLYLTLISIGIMILLYPLVAILMAKAIPHFGKQQSRIASINGYIEENLAAQHLIRAYGQAKNIEDEFNIKNKKLFKSNFKASLFSGIIYPYTFSASMILQFVVTIIGSIFLITNIGTGWGTAYTIGSLTSFLIFVRRTTNQVIRMIENMAQIQMTLVSAIRVIFLINLKPPVDQTTLANMPEKVEGNIEFKNVNFSYDPNSPTLQLKNANLKAKKGDVIAIVGPTGAGKTTIINLLSKFYVPNSGEVLMDNFSSTQINEQSWRDQISIVLQDTFLFKETILENLRYAKLDATDEEIYEAAKLSKAHEFISQLENGYQEIINEGGSNLSQGERQLLAITRAILANKNILILDEATSNVDTRTEKQLQEAMLTLMKGKTSFVIAHRLSTIVNSDLILVVNDGQIIEKGTHHTLLAQKGFYEKLYHLSFSED